MPAFVRFRQHPAQLDLNLKEVSVPFVQLCGLGFEWLGAADPTDTFTHSGDGDTWKTTPVFSHTDTTFTLEEIIFEVVP